MRLWHWVFAPAVLALLTTPSWAERWPIVRVPSPPPNTGGRPNLFVPYLTNGYSTYGVANGVAPIVFSSPQVDDPRNPDVRRVYNLVFYGSRLGFGDVSTGAATRPPGPPLGPPGRWLLVP